MADDRWAPVQADRRLGLPAGRVPWAVHELAYRAYRASQPGLRTVENIAEHGGFSWVELLGCIRGDYDALVRGDSTLWDELSEAPGA